MMIAQAQIEAMSSPSITNLTTGWAVIKSSKNEKPPVVAGLITSRGFIASIQTQMCKARRQELIFEQFGPGRRRPRSYRPARDRLEPHRPAGRRLMGGLVPASRAAALDHPVCDPPD